MFCPKCGSQNVDESKFCRGCGADLSNVLAIVEGRKLPEPQVSAEKYIELYTAALKALMIAGGFFFVAVLAFALSNRGLTFTLFALVFAFIFLATGISRLVHSRALKALREQDAIRPSPALTPGHEDYIKPSRPFYETDDLVARPLSVTEHTTTDLELDADGKAVTEPKS